MAADLVFDNLSTGYGGRRVIDYASGRFAAGALTCLLGANGAGKTSLLRAICGILPAAGGSVSLNGENLLAMPPARRAECLAYVPQRTLDPPLLTVEEFVTLGRAPFSAGRPGANPPNDSVSHALSFMDLLGFAGLRCVEISGGEWRKVLIAQGLAQEAQVLLLDEPTAFLDPPAKHSLLKRLRQYAHETGRTVAVVVHEPGLALDHADNCLLLRDGRVTDQGYAAAMLTPSNLEVLYGCDSDWWRPSQ